VGLNGRNPVPPGAVNLRGALGWAGADPSRLAARVLLALEWAMAHGHQIEQVRLEAQRRLLVPTDVLARDGGGWILQGLAPDGALVLERSGRTLELRRRFEDGPTAGDGA
jgi:BirA family biotin operon repressor/biotin-[acetyl-CoA-carboxylase] ligase